MSNASDGTDCQMSEDEAEKKLLDAADALAQVQNNYDGLTDAQEDMLGDAKSSVAAVMFYL